MKLILNPEQQAVVDHVSGPLRVAAVAGSGKTRALVERVAHLVEKRNVSPDSILLISFSANARDEMKRRVEKRLPGRDAGRCARTFHSIGLDIFKRETESDGAEWRTGRNAPEIDSSGFLWMKTMSTAYKDIGIKPEKKALKRFASLVKNGLLGTDETVRRLGGRLDPRMLALARNICDSGAAGVTADTLIEAFYAAEKIRSETGIEHQGSRRTFITFDDMIYGAAMLMKRQDVRERWSKRWKYVLQDEAQDENAAQGAIASALAHQHRNYVIVGDPAQAVFSFRGSRPERMLAFEKDWPGAKTITMHRNYRSGIEIVDLANAVIEHMPADTVIADDMGIVQPIVSERGTHAFLDYHVFIDPADEANAVAENIQAHQLDGIPWKEQTVLVRMNRMTRDVELALATRKIPYKLVSGSSFFSMREAKVVFGYLRLLLNRATEDDLASALMPVFGVGKAFVKKVAESHSDGASWLDTARSAARALSSYQRKTVLEWLDIMDDERAEIASAPISPYDYIKSLRLCFELDAYFNAEGEDAEDSRALDNLDAVLDYANGFENLEKLLDTVDDVETHRKSSARKRDAVIVSTCHKSKGGEWGVVYLVQASSAAFPAPKADLTEERRVFYVAVTRAKDELWVSRTVVDANSKTDDSCFIIETKLDLIATGEYVCGRKVDNVKVGTQLGLLV